MQKREIIAVDFDGTLCKDRYPGIGEPNMELILLLKQMQKQGSRLILWTCRCGERLEEALYWCKNLKIQFDAVNENVEEIIQKYGSDSRKIYADMYIDDKCCFPWEISENKEK